MNEHYFSEDPSSEIKEKNLVYSIKGKTLNFTSVSGVFSFGEKVDKASELLIKNFTPTGTKLLDMGCGYGAIGISIKSIFPELDVYMADVNNRAVEYSRINAKRNDLHVTAKKSDLFSEFPSETFHDIVSNPPIAAGKKLLSELIQQSCHHLEKGGALWLVAFHNKGGSTLKAIMKGVFNNVIDVEKSGGIRVYKSIR